MIYAEEMIVNWYALKGTGGFSDVEAKKPIEHLDEADQQIVLQRMIKKFSDLAKPLS
jgi:hypothetical protein